MMNVQTNHLESLKMLCQSMEEVTMPLKEYFKINYFSVNIIDQKNGLITLSNDKKFFQVFQDQEISKELQDFIFNTFPKTGIYLVNYNKLSESMTESLKIIYQNFSISDAVIFIEIYTNELDTKIIQYSFNLDSTHDTFNQNLMDNLDLIKEFSKYFLKRFSNVLKNLYQNVDRELTLTDRVNFEKFVHKSFEVKSSPRNQFAMWLYKRSVSNKINRRFSLTKKEEQILKLTVTERLTSKKIAERLDISKRTVDRHFENMRLKFSEFSKAGLINKALKLNLLNLNDQE